MPRKRPIALILQCDNLICGSCGARFSGSLQQARKVMDKNQPVYCSKPCFPKSLRSVKVQIKLRLARLAALTRPLIKCIGCGDMFLQKTNMSKRADYCTVACRTAAYKRMARDRQRHKDE